jgi:hypothetical protein
MLDRQQSCRRQLRGEIVRDDGTRSKNVTTDFSDEQVEVYVVKDNVCLAKDRIPGPIKSQ